MNPDDRCFGWALKSLRIGWGWSSLHGCYVRISDAGKDAWRVEVAPASGPLMQRCQGTHYLWWMEPGVLRLCPFLEDIFNRRRTVNDYQTIIVDSLGREQLLSVEDT